MSITLDEYQKAFDFMVTPISRYFDNRNIYTFSKYISWGKSKLHITAERNDHKLYTYILFDINNRLPVVVLYPVFCNTYL